MQPLFYHTVTVYAALENCNATRSESFCLKRECLQYEIHMNVSKLLQVSIKKRKNLLINCHRKLPPAFSSFGGRMWGLARLLSSEYLPFPFFSSNAKLKQSIKIPALIIEGETAGYSAQAFLMWRVLKRCMDASPEGDGRASWSRGSVHLKIMCASAKARWPEKCSEDHYSPQSGLRDGHQADKILSIFMPLNQLYPHVLQMQIIWQAKHFQSDSADCNNWMQDTQS